MVNPQAPVAAEGKFAVIPPAVAFLGLLKQTEAVGQAQVDQGLQLFSFGVGAVDRVFQAHRVPHVEFVKSDVVLKRAIPYKGQVLNQIASYFLDMASSSVPNWKVNCPDPNVTIGYYCKPYMVEMVIRGYLSGHAWREYKEGKREICGVKMPDGLRENDPFPNPIITPTIKAMQGHDLDISREEIIKQNLVSKEEYEQIEEYTNTLFKIGSDAAKKQNLILVDTKYEFGNLDGRILLIDEIHTPDSSRYFYNETYNEIQNKDQQQRQLSKEFVRQWLIENGFQGEEGQHQPLMTDEFVASVTNRYIELFEQITGSGFVMM